MVHESATGSPPAPNIPSTTHDYTTPAALGIDTWGWNLGTASSTSTFKKIPPSGDGQTIRTTDAPSSAPSPDSETIVTFGANVTDTTVAGAYINTMVFTATTNYVPPVAKCNTGGYECILFTINTTDGTYSIPTSGYVAGMDHAYDWDVYVDGILTTDCPGGNCTGTSSQTTAPGVDGITLTGLSSGQHQIKILPHSSPAPGWGNAFGHIDSATGANTLTNTDKLISIDSPLTTMAFAPKITESTTSASYMFASLFAGCTNLTKPAILMDTYKLPSTITDLSYFLYQPHYRNASLTTPIDLAPLAGWFSNNSSITNLSSFLRSSHSGNLTLTNPTDLTPLAGWFNTNSSITNLSNFLDRAHYNNTNLTTPIDLTPLAGWFNANTSITNFSNFIQMIHFGNIYLTTPIDLTPLAGWFNANTSITDLSSFLYSVYYDNTNLTTTTDLTPLAGWFNTNSSITNLSNFLRSSHDSNTNLSTPIDLTPLAGWFNTNTSITDLSNFLFQVHNRNSILTNPIDLTPLAGWFNTNSSITNLSNFLRASHYTNTSLTNPIDFTPLGNWFNSGRSFTSLEFFLYLTHSHNPNLTLSGQIVFPNWMKTATESGTPIWNVASTFAQTFYVPSTKTDDTGEPRFQDGTVLSSIGTPTTNNQAYFNRSGITPVNTGWQ